MAYNYASRNYYSDERKLYSEAYDIQVDNKKGLKILKKLCKHYEVIVPNVRFWGHSDSGCDGWRGIRLSNKPSIGLIMHEFSHYAKAAICQKEHLTFENQGTSHHGTRFQACLNFVNQYAKSKDYWRKMVAKSEVTVIKPEEKSEAEIIQEGVHMITKIVEEKKEEIAHVEQKLETYKKRLQYFTKLYSTKIKKANRSLGAHKRALDKILHGFDKKDLTKAAGCDIVSFNNKGENHE